jgi:predicted nuclease of predicted toxin-antitoxin system
MRFFLVECIPKSALDMLIAHGHDASPITDYVPPGSPDLLVATVAEENDAILVSHDRDFRKLAPRVAHGERRRFRPLSIVKMECKEPRIVQRLEYNLPVILSSSSFSSGWICQIAA